MFGVKSLGQKGEGEKDGDVLMEDKKRTRCGW